MNKRINFQLLLFLTAVLSASCVATSPRPPDEGALAAPQQRRTPAPDTPPAVLVSAGRPVATIVVPDPGAAWQNRLYARAATELQQHVEKSSGAKLPILAAAAYTHGPAVFVGFSPAAQRAGFEDQPLPSEGFRVVTRNGHLAILGHDDDAERYGCFPGTKVEKQPLDSTGTLFGVYDLLERYLGVRWYWPGDLGTIVPPHADVVIPPLDYQDAPLLGRRTMWPYAGYPDSPKDLYAAAKRWREGNGSGVIWNHSYNYWGGLYGKTHPEYFALKKDGSRETSYFGGQICFSEPGVLRQELTNLENFYGHGDAAPWGDWVVQPRERYVQLMVPDCFGACECAACQQQLALRQAAEPPLEANSELIHGYYAKVARELKQRWPDKELLVGAYSTCTLPPRTVTYPDNVRIAFCVMDGLAYHREPAIWKRWFEVIDRYRQMTGKPVEIWNYICWPQTSTKAPLHFPHLVNRWHREARDRISGEFVNGETGRSFALDHLTMYFWFKSMWNPDFDVDAALAEYYSLCYGPAAPAMKRYYDLLISRWETVTWDQPAGRISGLPLDMLYGKTFPKEVRDRLQALEREARAAAPADSDAGRRVALVLAAHQEFYKEADTFERLGRGYVGIVERGTPSAIDGKLDDPCWRREGARFVLGPTAAAAPLDSRVRLCWDDQALSVAARFAEPNMKGLVTRAQSRDGMAWDDDCLEIFLSPGNNPESYAQIAINAAGAIFDGWKPTVAAYSEFRNFAIEQAIARTADGWTLEVRIPFTELEAALPHPGASWRANFIRCRRAGKGVDQPAEHSYFSPTLGQSHHNTRFFGTLIFTDSDRFHEDFGADAAARWSATAQSRGTNDPQSWAKLELADGKGTLKARMSRNYHIAGIHARPNVTVRRGDLLEILYRGPLLAPGRLETTFTLQTAGAEKPHFGWLADNSKLSKDLPRRFMVDLFAIADLPASTDQATLSGLSILMSSEPGSENALQLDLIRVSPHTVGTVE